MDYKLIRSNRRTLAIYITKNADIEVRAPLKMTGFDINHFVESKKNWINKKLDLIKNRNVIKSGFSLNYGSKIMLMGSEYPVTSVTGNRKEFDGESFNIPENLSSEDIKQAVIKIYKQLAGKILKQKVLTYSNIMGVSPTAVKINSAKTRWGSCSGKNSLNFTWKLICCCDDVIDYVVVHELSHIKEHNHSKRFWAEVGKIIPDYKEANKKLKQIQKQLTFQNWD